MQIFVHISQQCVNGKSKYTFVQKYVSVWNLLNERVCVSWCKLFGWKLFPSFFAGGGPRWAAMIKYEFNRWMIPNMIVFYFYISNEFSESERGGWGSWSEWTPCSSTCSGGTRNRYRVCDSPPPRYGAMFCEVNDFRNMVFVIVAYIFSIIHKIYTFC